jgi:CO/xanthine dehydrogenase FAD-binding subunit
MIPHNLVYYRPSSLEEAVAAYREADEAGLDTFYYGGGTEILTFARRGNLKPGAVIDIKHIPECMALREEGGRCLFGAGLPLNAVIEGGSFPLLSRAAVIVDHTVRNRLSLGGNIAGRLPYRETVLPFLLADAEARLVGPDGERGVPLREVFDRRLKLESGELLISLSVPRAITETPWFYRRRVRKTRLDYPVLTACFVKVEGQIRAATTAAFGFPAWSPRFDDVLNDGAIPVSERPARAIDAAGLRIADNARASAAYRRALLESAIGEALDALL